MISLGRTENNQSARKEIYIELPGRVCVRVDTVCADGAQQTMACCQHESSKGKRQTAGAGSCYLHWQSRRLLSCAATHHCDTNAHQPRPDKRNCTNSATGCSRAKYMYMCNQHTDGKKKRKGNDKRNLKIKMQSVRPMSRCTCTDAPMRGFCTFAQLHNCSQPQAESYGWSSPASCMRCEEGVLKPWSAASQSHPSRRSSGQQTSSA